MVFRSIFTASFFFVGENTSAGTVSVRGAAKRNTLPIESYDEENGSK